MTLYDLADYLCPNSKDAFILVGVGGTNAYEICQSVRDGKGYARFLKNQHHETLWFDDANIFRGLDTSNLPNEVYSQFTGERYGAIWCKRYMNEGDVTQRNPDIRLYDANGKLLRTAPGGVSYLRLVKHYDQLTFSDTDRTLKDVIELHWTFDREGKNLIEIYWYAAGLGLAGFDYKGTPPFQSRFAGFSAEKPSFVPLPNFTEPVPPPIQQETPPMPNPYVSPPMTGARGVLARLPNVFVNIREQPYTDAGDRGDLRKGEPLTYGFSDQAPGWARVFRFSDGVNGWVSLQAGAVEFAPDEAPPTHPPVSELPRWTTTQLAALRGASGVLLQLIAEAEGEPTDNGGNF